MSLSLFIAGVVVGITAFILYDRTVNRDPSEKPFRGVSLHDLGGMIFEVDTVEDGVTHRFPMKIETVRQIPGITGVGRLRGTTGSVWLPDDIKGGRSFKVWRLIAKDGRIVASEERSSYQTFYAGDSFDLALVIEEGNDDYPFEVLTCD